MTGKIGRFITIISIIFSLVLLTGCPADPVPQRAINKPGLKLTIMHTNDTHARILQFDSHGNTCSEEKAGKGECFGGVARRAYMANKIRGEEPNVLFVDAGDQFQGTLFYTHFLSKAIFPFMNDLKYDAMTLGNHEFDAGPGELAKFVSVLNFPVISSNIDFEKEPLLKGLIKPYEVRIIDSWEVGIIGYTTRDVPLVSNPGPNVVFNDIPSSVRRAVSELEGKGVTIIIALSHAGLASDMEIAEAVDGIDIIIGGHTHTLLSNTDEKAEGTYPIMVNSPSGDPVLVATAESWGKYLGDLTVTFDNQGVVDEWSGDPILLDSSVPEDENFLLKAKEFDKELAKFRTQVVGETLTDLDGSEDVNRYGESKLGNLLTDALLWETKDQGVQIAFFNGGGIRAGLTKGKITQENILTIMPFLDTLSTFHMKGSDLRGVLEYGVSQAESTQNEGTGRFLHAAGLKYTWTPNKPVGSRIIDVSVMSADGSYVPLDDEAVYYVTASDFLRSGGDGFALLRDNAIDPYDFGRDISEIFMDYLGKFSPVNPKIEGRIKKIGK